MSKVAVILLGVLLFAAAGGFAAYRFLLKPEQTASHRSAYPQGAARGPARDVQPGRPGDRQRPNVRPGREQFSGYSMLELAMDLINAFVGLVGIFVAIIGLRMSRSATMSQSQMRGGS